MRTALVTGASRGLGREISNQLVLSGWDVIFTSRHPMDSKILEMDVTSRLQVQKVRNKVEKLDLLVNNAGIFPEKNDVLQANEHVLLNVFMVNVLGPLIVTQEFWPLLRESKGKVINITSRRGLTDVKDCKRANYSLTKNCLNHLTRLLSIQGQEDGVCVNTICPGHFKSCMGGDHAPLTLEEAASHVLWLVDQNVNGKLFLGREEANW